MTPIFPTQEPLVGLYRGTSLISRLIQWQTRSVASHASLYLPGGSVIESWHIGGVQKHDDAGAVHTPGTVIELYCVEPPVNWAAALNKAQSQLGKGYDFLSVARFITRRDAGCNPSRWFCSSLVFAAVEAGGVSLLDRVCPTDVSPAMLRLSPLLRKVGEVTTR